MGIGSIGSTSFWQQDQNFWSQAKAQSQTQAATNAQIQELGTLQTNKFKGLAAIANKTALDRVNAQYKAALESAVQTLTGSSSSSSNPNGSPATGTGTVALAAETSLLTLGIPPNGKVNVSDGTNTTTYASTGTDTVGDLINAINTSGPKNAKVTASLDASGRLVVTGSNVTDTITVGGLFASNVGFANKNDSFKPTAPTPSASSSSAASTSSSTSAASSSSSNTSSSNSSLTGSAAFYNSSVALQTGSSALSLLGSAGLTGSLLDIVG